ncbi:unnamed protein product, partial [Linum tenue]
MAVSSTGKQNDRNLEKLLRAGVWESAYRMKDYIFISFL